MKVLFFILGSIKNRIDAWGVDNYKKILDQDIVFFGPIIENSYHYNERNIPIIRIYKETSISDLFEMLPNSWIPDILLCETPIINLIPDIYKCPSKTYLLIRDSWADAIFNKGIVELFDSFNYSVIDRESYTEFNSKMLPLANSAVSLPEKLVFENNYKNRDIDILAIANYNDGFYHDRYKLFTKISKELPKNIKVKFFTGLKKGDIHIVYRNAKIVVDWSHTLSNRSFEAALNGCLFFSHENNPLIKEYWIDGEEYVAFNESNISKLLISYLNNYNESIRIIGNASKKIKEKKGSFGEFLYKHMKLTIDLDIIPQKRIEYNNSINKSILWHRLATMFYFNYHYPQYNIPSNWQDLYFERIREALSFTNNEDIKKTLLIEVMRMAYLLNKESIFYYYKKELTGVYPEYPWQYILNAKILFRKKDFLGAVKEIQLAIDHHKSSPNEINKFILPFNENNNSVDARRITNNMWKSANIYDFHFEEKAFLFECYSLLGQANIKNNNNTEAIKNLKLAIEQIPAPKTMHLLLELLNSIKDYETIDKITDKSYAEYPYDLVSIFFKCIANLNMKKRKENIRLLKQTRDSFRAFECKSKYLNIIRLKKMLVNFGIAASWLPTFLIIKHFCLSIGILNKKLY